jgi:hypothetical protein
MSSKTRQCPFYGCSNMIDPQLFACRHHWPTLGDDDRIEIWKVYTEFLDGKIRVEELVRRQALVMLKNTSQTVPGAATGPGQGEVDLARKVAEYVALRKEYSHTKDGFLEKKRQLGMKLTKLEAELTRRCKAILHPEQKQLSLFDDPAGPVPDPRMPD